MLTPEELEVYRAKCENVGRCLYSYGGHFQRWEDTPQSVKDKYIHMAHMARVWWNSANQIPKVFYKRESAVQDSESTT
jgi:hypothetical protein